MATNASMMLSSTTARKNTNAVMHSSSRSAMSVACSTSKSGAFQKKMNYAPTSPSGGVPLRRRRTMRTNAVARGPGGGEFFEEEEKKYENNQQDMSSASSSTNNGSSSSSSSSSSSKASSSSSHVDAGAKNELDP